MSSDEEHRSRRRHKDSRKRKDKRSSRPDSSSSRLGSSRSATGAEDEHDETSGGRKGSSKERYNSNRKSRRSHREEEGVRVDIPSAREENIFTRGIPAPPLASHGLDHTNGDQYTGNGEENDDEDDYSEEGGGITSQPQVAGDEDSGDSQDDLERSYTEGGAVDQTSHRELDGRTTSELREALSRCEWERFFDVVNKTREEGVKLFCETPDEDLQSIPFQLIMGRAPAAISLLLLDLLQNEVSTLCMARDANGNTALHLFCANVEMLGKRELMLLTQLVHGAPRSLQLPNAEGDTPLHLLAASRACATSDLSTGAAAEKAVSILLEESQDVAIIQDSLGATPLHVAISHGAYERVLLKLLELAPVASKVADNQGMLPLHYFAAFWYAAPTPVQTVFDAYPEALTATTVDGDTPLHLLISNHPGEAERLDISMMKVVEILIGLGAKDRQFAAASSPIANQNNEKLTPIHCCALFDAPHQIAQTIMSHPLAKNACLIPNMFGATALHMAVAQQSVAVSINNILALGTTEAAAAEDRLKRSPLHVAAQNVNATATMISAVCELCPDAISMRTQRGHLPLHLAAQSQAKEPVVRALLRADPKAAEVRNKSSNTPLHDAAKYRASEGVVRLLLETYPDAVYVQNQYGNLPLHCATAYQALPEVIQLLLEAWSDGAAMQNRNQDAPLHYAAAYTTSVDAVRPLIDAAPAAVLLLNSSGQSPIDRARANNAPLEIIDLLEESAEEWTKKASQDGWGAFSPDVERASRF